MTSLPEDTETVLKLFAALVSVMLPPGAFKVVVPAAVTGPVCVIGPLAVIVSAPLEVVPGLALALPIEIAFACCQAISPPVKLTLLKLLPGVVKCDVAALPRRSSQIGHRQRLARIEAHRRSLRQVMGIGHATGEGRRCRGDAHGPTEVVPAYWTG